jgi:hypothetical protein
MEQHGDLAHRQVVEVAEGERGPMLDRQLVEDVADPQRIELFVPGVGLLGALAGEDAEAPFVPGLAAPVVAWPLR